MGRRKRFDSVKEDKEDLYGEIRRLRKQVRSLQRENARVCKSHDIGKSATLEEPVFDENMFQAGPEQPKCERCGSKVTVMELTTRTEERIHHLCKKPGCMFIKRIKKV